MSDSDEKVTPADSAGRNEQDQELAEQLVDRAKADGLDLVGTDGVLTGQPEQGEGPSAGAARDA